VTGVETAGLVLATFPLVVDGLQHWVRGADSIRRRQKVRRELESYATRLKNQRVTCLDTLEQFLTDIFPSDEELAKMTADPGGTS
jgi:uncharacterized protein YeeX (DUF496 family)